MKKDSFLVAVVFVSALVLLIGSLVMAQGDSGSQRGVTSGASLVTGDDSNPSGPATIIIPPQYQAQDSHPADETTTPASTATTEVYFTPQDENTSTTILFLYNTGATAATVTLQAFNTSGGLVLATPINIPANHLARIAGDNVSTISPTWANSILIDFRNDSAYAKLTLPAHVKVDGYVAWTNGTFYDPLVPVPVLPLRFSSDPLNVFLPSLADD